MSARLAPTTFASGPEDSLAAVNVYKATSNEVVNSITDIAQKYDFSLLDSVRGGDYLRAASPIVTGVIDGAAVINKEGLISRLVGASEAGMGTLREMSSGVLDSVSGAIDWGKDVYVEVEGVASKVAGSAIESLSDLGKLVGDVTGTSDLFKVTDNEGVAGLFSGIIDECRNLGIRGAFSLVTSSITDPNLLNNIVGKSLDNVIATSDKESLIGIAAKTTKGVISAVNPYAISDFARQYTYPLNQKIGEVTYGHADLFTAFDTIDDAWDKYDRVVEVYDAEGNKQLETQRAIDVTTVQGSSSDFKSLIRAANDANQSTDDRPESKFYQLGELYESVDVRSSAKSQFPYSTVDVSPDPRLAAMGQIQWGDGYIKLLREQAKNGDANAKRILMEVYGE